MSGRLGSVRPREFIRKIQRLGFQIDHQTGSHVVLYHSQRGRLVVPMHSREMKRGLLMALLKQAGLTTDEYQKIK